MSRRRGRSRVPGRVWLRLYGVLVLASWVALLFLDPVTSTADPDAAPDPATTTSTPYLRTVASSLARTHVYVDPTLAGLAPSGLVDGSLHDTVVHGSPATYVAVMFLGQQDGSAGDETLTLERLHHLVGRDGVYVVDPENGFCWTMTFRGTRRDVGYCGGVDAGGIADMRKRASSDAGDARAAAIVYPFMVGAGACALIGWALDAMGALRRRRQGVVFLRAR